MTYKDQANVQQGSQIISFSMYVDLYFDHHFTL